MKVEIWKSLIWIGLFISCSSTHQDVDKNKNTAIHFYFDITEGIDSNIRDEYFSSLDEALKYLDLDLSKREGGEGYGEICFSLLNYEYFEKPLCEKLSARNNRNENPILKKGKVKNFINQTRSNLESILNVKLNKKDTTSSIICKHIIDAVFELKKSNFNKKILIIYSDLIEHNPKDKISFISFFKKNNQSKEHYNKIKSKIEDTYSLKFPTKEVYGDIEIYIIRPDHEKYRSQRLNVENFWKTIFSGNCHFQRKLKLPQQ